MKIGKVYYSFSIVMAVAAIFCCSKLTVSAMWGNDPNSGLADRVSGLFRSQSTPDTSFLGPVSVSIPSVSSSPSTVVTVPVITGDITGLNVNSFDFQVTYDPAILTPATPAFDNAGTLSCTMIVTPNNTFPGHFVISAFQA